MNQTKSANEDNVEKALDILYFSEIFFFIFKRPLSEKSIEFVYLIVRRLEILLYSTISFWIGKRIYKIESMKVSENVFKNFPDSSHTPIKITNKIYVSLNII